MAVSPDQHTLVAGNTDGTLQRWKLALPRPLEAIAIICDALHRDLTQLERLQYLPIQSPRQGCPQ
jgi:hypothetical protein